MKWNNNRTACIQDIPLIQPDQGRCQDLLNQFQSLLKNNQFGQARSILEQARNCSFYNQAANLLRDANQKYCLQMENEIARACQAGDKNRAQTLLNQAQNQGCRISPNALKACQQPQQPPKPSGDQDPILGLWNTPDGGQAKIEARTTGPIYYVGKVKKQGTFWKERNMKIGDEVWGLNKQTDGHYLGKVLVKGNFYWQMPLEVWVKGNNMTDSKGKVVATKAQ